MPPSYAGAQAFRALGGGLENIARMLVSKREDERRREEQDFASLMAGGIAGPQPTITTPGAMEPLADQPPWELESAVEGTRMPTRMAPPVTMETRPDERFIEAPGGRVHFKHPAVQERETADRTALADLQQRDLRYKLLGGLEHVPDEAARAMAYADIPSGVALPRTPTQRTVTDRGIPTVDGAYRILVARYTKEEFDEYGNSIKVLTKPEDEIWAEAQGMARGKPMTPTASDFEFTTAPERPSAPRVGPEAPGGPSWLENLAQDLGGVAQKLGQTVMPGGERGFLGPKPAVADTTGTVTDISASEAQRTWDELATRYGKERTEREIGPRPLR